MEITKINNCENRIEIVVLHENESNVEIAYYSDNNGKDWYARHEYDDCKVGYELSCWFNAVINKLNVKSFYSTPPIPQDEFNWSEYALILARHLDNVVDTLKQAAKKHKSKK